MFEIFCFTQKVLEDEAGNLFPDDIITHIGRLSCIESFSVREGSQTW